MATPDTSPERDRGGVVQNSSPVVISICETVMKISL
jgi:hypothetical protein